MQAITKVVGIALIIFGIAVLGYQGFTYTQHEKVAQVGSIQVSANVEKTVFFPPLIGGLALVVGVILVAFGIRSD